MIKEKFNGDLILSIRGYKLEYNELQKRPKKIIPEKTYNKAAHCIQSKQALEQRSHANTKGIDYESRSFRRVR